ncbi:MAG: TonB-dependent receptor [Symploca sp. SIO2G7]|nr:TonB-dependent receptor [Symploca sp. SIO2G7]
MNIEINPGVNGLEVLLESGQEIDPQFTETFEGNTLILEISGIQLSPAADQLFSPDPLEGIEEITVTQQPGNVVQIRLTGTTAPPFATVTSGGSGLVVEVIPDEFLEEVEVVVTATRSTEELIRVPRSVTLIEEEDIQQQASATRNLSEILGKLVPGFSPTTQTSSIFGQTLRGRNISVLIDGVPQSTNRNAQRDFRTIDPGVIERIEIVRGPSAIYGDGATGGIVNIITKSGAEEELVSESTVGLNFSTTNPEDSYGYTFQHSVSGTQDRFSYNASAAVITSGGFFDFNGDRIPPDPTGQGGLSDLTTVNLYGKFGYELDDNQRIEFTANHFLDSQDTDFAVDPFNTTDVATAREGLVLEDQAGSENTVLNLVYRNASILGSQLNAQVYYRNYSTRFSPFNLLGSAAFGNNVLQSEVESEKFGTRVDIETPILPEDQLNIVWGVDYFHEDSSQPADLFDPVAFANSLGLVFNPNGEGFLSPPSEQDSLGLFAQLTWNATDSLTVNGGIRQEFIDVSVDDFTTLAGAQVTGGDLNYDATLFNIGAIYAITENVGIFSSFSQGFSIADVPRAIRTAPNGSSVEILNPEAQKVDSYELGIRGQWNNIQASVAGFYSYSDLGTTFTQDADIVRDPQRIYGVEADINAQITNQFALGGSFTYIDGERDPDDDGNFDTELPTSQIPPIKLTGYLEYEPIPGWFNRFQVLYSAERDPEGDGFGLGLVEDYFTADLISSYDTGYGTIQVSVENLFNEEYAPIISQITGGISRYAARGRAISVQYRVEW